MNAFSICFVSGYKPRYLTSSCYQPYSTVAPQDIANGFLSVPVPCQSCTISVRVQLTGRHWAETSVLTGVPRCLPALGSHQLGTPKPNLNRIKNAILKYCFCKKMYFCNTVCVHHKHSFKQLVDIGVIRDGQAGPCRRYTRSGYDIGACLHGLGVLTCLSGIAPMAQSPLQAFVLPGMVCRIEL